MALAVPATVDLHRFQLSWNLRDSPGFLALVPGPGRPYLSPIVCPGSKLVSFTMSHFLLHVIRISHTMCEKGDSYVLECGYTVIMGNQCIHNKRLTGVISVIMLVHILNQCG